MSPRFSIIIPHKNSVDLLERCLKSIPVRDDIEVIVVDDNSTFTPNERQKIESFNDNQTLVLFTKEGRGAGYARNVGLDHASGGWVLFADADDYFYTKNLEIMLSSNIPSEYQVIVYGAKYVFLDGSHKWYGWYDPEKPNSMSIERMDYPQFLYRRLVTPWIKMVRKDLLVDNNIRFEEVMFSNDELFCTKVALAIHYYGKVNMPIYHHVRLSTGLVESTTNKRRFMIRWNVYLRKEIYLKKHGTQVPDYNLLSAAFFYNKYNLLLYCAVKEAILLGKKKAWRDYTSFCRQTQISRIPYLYMLRNQSIQTPDIPQ